MSDFHQAASDAVWIAKSLYDRGKTSGSSANMSFLCDGGLYITASGTCFGRLAPEDFVPAESPAAKPSKELPLHQALYRRHPEIGAVIHVHSTYATVWSCLPHPDENDVIPAHTPYLAMKLGRVPLVPYAPPGSEELFALFSRRVAEPRGYLLANHGPVVGGSTLMDAYYALEELEESARIAWLLRQDLGRCPNLQTFEKV